MKYLLSILILLLLASTSCNHVTSEQNFTNKKEAQNLLKDEAKEGKWLEYIAIDNKFTIDTLAPYYRLTIYRYGKPFGIVREYYRGGELRRESHYPYTDGKKNGADKFYYENGKLEWEGTYKDNKLYGTVKQYYENGNIYRESTFTNGEENGLEKGYYENGKLRFEYPYTDGEINGIQKEYYENGNIKGEYNFTNGKQKGLQKSYYKNGKLMNEFGFADGSTVSYDSNGIELPNNL